MVESSYASLIKVGLSFFKESDYSVILAVDPQKIDQGDVRDVDIIVDESEIDRICEQLEKYYRTRGGVLVKKIRNEYNTQLFFLKKIGLNLIGCQWDVIPGASWRGFPYMSISDLAEFKFERDGLDWITSEGKKGYNNLRDWLWKGMELNNDGLSLLGCDSPDPSLRKKIILKNFKRTPVKSAMRVFSYFKCYILRFWLRPPGKLFIDNSNQNSSEFLGQGFGGYVVGENVFNNITYLDKQTHQFTLKALAFWLFKQRELYRNSALIISGEAFREMKSRSFVFRRILRGEFETID